VNGLAAEVPELRRSSGNGMRNGTDSASGPARKKGHGIRMGAARRRQAGKLSNLGERRRWLSGYAVAFLVGAAVAAGAITLLFGANADTEKTGTPAASRSLAQLLSMRPEELERADIAEMNLLCAAGLPGAEGLDLERCLARLDRWADRVRRETARHLYRLSDPQYAEHYRNSEAYFRVSMLLQVLQEDCGVHYNKERVRDIDFTNSQDLFLHGMVGADNGGTCVSMPVLYLAVGRRLEYPMYLVLAKAHVFARWDDPESGERFNIEGAGDGFSSFPDEHYRMWPSTLTQADLATGHYLKSLTSAQELAVFLAARGHCLEDTGRLPEARLAYAQAHRLDPKSREYVGFLARALGGLFRRPQMAEARRPRPRDALETLRRIEAMNEANRRRITLSVPAVPQVPVVPGGSAPVRSPHPAGPIGSGVPRP